MIARSLLPFLLAGCALAAHAQTPARQTQSPETASGLATKQAVHARRFMIATANPHATRAGYDVLKAGGSAVDAAIAAQLVLNLVEPESSGIGGGAFIVHYDAASGRLAAYDGRETAPAAAKPDRFLDPDGKPLPLAAAIGSGKSVGVPGLLRVLELAHKKHGRLRWVKLFEPAIRLAERGFPIGARLARQIAADPMLAADPAARAYFFDAEGKPRAAGALLKNPAFAQVLREIAAKGPDAFYRGPLAHDIVAAVAAHPRPGDMTEADLAGYRAKERAALCGRYRAYKVCGMPPPSSGGIAVLEILGALERFPMAQVRPGSAEAVHLISEAGRLAYADRDAYVGDPDFVDVPAEGLIAPAYVKSRGALIRMETSMGRASPGRPSGARGVLAPDEYSEVPATSHLSVIDDAGNALAMTTTIEATFGSRIMVRGFLLNNEMTDFSLAPEENGALVANRVEAGKRPRSSMAPTLVFGADGKLKMTVGSPGGSAIINYVAKTLIGVLDWKLDVQQAIALPNMGSRNRDTEIEKDSMLENLAGPLRALGHPVASFNFASGIQGIVVGNAGLEGGADPRREGNAMGD